ncbi:MAG: insulinase family protein [Proteobacteria bacterium]|nr:insulinase family protein [Pseudomonadota bacterium]
MTSTQPRIQSALSIGFALVFSFLLLSIAACPSHRPLKNKEPNPLFKNDPTLIQGTFENGFRYVLKKNQEPKQRVSMHLVILAGSIHEEDSQRGLAHFLEHMMFNGTRHFPPGELVKYFQSIGMQFGGDANAHTGFYETVYDVVLPRGDKKNLTDGMRVLYDFADGALLPEAEVQKEKNVILSEKRDRDSADYRMFESTLKFELPDMRLAKRLPIGDEEVIRNTNQDGLKQYYDTWYRPDRMILVVVGDFDEQLALPMLTETFSFMKARDGAAKDPEPGDIRHKGLKTFSHYEKEIGKTTVALEVLNKIPTEEDSLGLRQDELIKRIATGMIQNRLDVLTRKSDSPVTSVSTSAGVFLRHVEYAAISADCSPENWEKALAFVEQNLRQALVFGFSQQELNRIRQDTLSEMEQNVKAATTRNSNMLSSEIIQALANGKTILSPQDTLVLLGPFVRSISLKEVNTAFKDIWEKNHRLVLVTGNTDLTMSKPSPDEKIRQVYEESKNVTVVKRTEDAKVTFPYLEEPKYAGEISYRKDIQDLGVTTVEFKNGVRLNLKKTDFDANQILFKLIAGGGKACEPLDKPGLASLAMNLINESGFKTLDKEDLNRALAGKNTQMYFSVSEDSFVISGSSVPNETALIFQLLRTQLLDPGFHEDAYFLTMERMKQNYEEMETTVSGMDSMYGEAFLAGNDPRFGLPPFNIYRKNTIKDVEDWMGKVFKDEGLELSLVGDFDPEAVIDLTAIYLGSLPSGRKPYVPLIKGKDIVPCLPRSKTLTLSVKTVIPKGLVKVAYPTDDFWDISRTRRLSVLGAVFSEKLRNTIREELGAAYSPYAYNQSSIAFPGYGVFQAVVTLDPALAGLVAGKIEKISQELIQNGITDDELKRSVDPILTSIRDMRRTNGYWLNSVLSGSGRYPDKFEWTRTMEKDYGSITAVDIQTVAGQYLDNQNAAILTILPEK